jgi:hypothetical protein
LLNLQTPKFIYKPKHASSHTKHMCVQSSDDDI